MTVTSRKSHPVLSALQSLLKPSDADPPQLRTASLAKKVSTACATLQSTPSLHPLALETLADAILFQHAHYDLQPASGVTEATLDHALCHTYSVLDSMLQYCPREWSKKIFKWGVAVLGRLSVQGRAALPPLLEDAMRAWLVHPTLAPVHNFISKCANHMVCGGDADCCMRLLVEGCCQYAPHLNWLLAHVVSQYPAALMPLLLDHALSPSPSHLPRPSPARDLVQVLELLSRTHREALRQCVVGVAVRGGGGEGVRWGRSVMSLLRLCIRCQPLIDIAAEECLNILTVERIQSIVLETDKSTPTDRSHDLGDDEDEGEVHSDEEEEEEEEEGGEGRGGGGGVPGSRGSGLSPAELVPLVAGLVALMPGREAARALRCLMQLHTNMKQCVRHQVEAMEEGEIERTSPAEVVMESCEAIMGEVLSQLHAACSFHLTPSSPSSSSSSSSAAARVAGKGGGGGGALQFAVGLYSGVAEWCGQLLTQDNDPVCASWLKEIVTAVSVCSSELEAAKVVADLFCNCRGEQVTMALDIYWDLQCRYPHIAKTIVHVVMGTLLKSKHSNVLERFTQNMLFMLTEQKLTSQQHRLIRSQITDALQPQLLVLAETLASPGGHCVFRLLTELLTLPGKPDVGVAQRYKLCQTFLAHDFVFLKQSNTSLLQTGLADFRLEESLGRMRRLVALCGQHSSACRMLLLSTILDSPLLRAEGLRELLSPPNRPPLDRSLIRGGGGGGGGGGRGQSLLSSNQFVGLGHSTGGVGGGVALAMGKLQHSGTLRTRQTRDSAKTENSVQLCATHCVSHVIQLLVAVGDGDSTNQLASVFMDQVAPHAPPSLEQWPSEESLKYSLEWDLAVKRKFDDAPILWNILSLISEDPGGLFVCASIVRSLLTVLSQHWQRCRVSKTAFYRHELKSCSVLVECMAKSQWLPHPLSHVTELLNHVTPYEVHLLLSSIISFLQANFADLKTSPSPSGCGKGSPEYRSYCTVLKSILLKHIDSCGHLFARHLARGSNTSTAVPL